MIDRNVHAGWSLNALDGEPAEELAVGLRPVELRPLLERILLELRPAIQAQGVRFCYEASGILPAVRGNSPELYQAFTNIIRNALQSMPQGGRLSVSVSYFADDGHPGTVEVRVDDTGSGMPRENQEKVFRPDVALKPDGSRASLAWTRATVISSGGSMVVRSEPGAGSVSIVTLPAIRPGDALLSKD